MVRTSTLHDAVRKEKHKEVKLDTLIPFTGDVGIMLCVQKHIALLSSLTPSPLFKLHNYIFKSRQNKFEWEF